MTNIEMRTGMRDRCSAGLLAGLLTAALCPAAAAATGLDCILDPNQVIDVSSPVEGVISEVFVDRGDRVRKGQTLLKLNSDLEQAERQLAQTRVDFGERTIARNDELGDLLSDHEIDEMETDLKLARVELLEAETRIEMKSVKSPIAGIITERMRDAGEFIATEAAFTVVSIDPLFVEVIVPVEHLYRIKVGSVATVTPETPVDRPFQATVIYTDPVVDPASGTFRVRLELPNPGSAIPSGLRCAVDFAWSHIE